MIPLKALRSVGPETEPRLTAPENRKNDNDRQREMNSSPEEKPFRALFLSDFHLGTRGCKVQQLLNFLAHHDADTIYLVGDIIDGWRLDVRWYWPDEHAAVLQILMEKARNGSRLVYLPGNHDDFVREFTGTRSELLEFEESVIHEAADGNRYLILHGDCFDPVQSKARWLAKLGDWAYVFALGLNAVVNGVGRRFGVPYWSFSSWAKSRVKGAVSFIGRYEERLADAARNNAVDGVICGHIHHAAHHEDFGLIYVNCGDWVESCTAAIEHRDGRMEVVNWGRVTEPAPIDPRFGGEESEGESEGVAA